MYELTKLRLIALFVVGLFACVNNASAKDCYEKSPNLVEQGDNYFKTDTYVVVTDEAKTLLDDLFNKAAGKWEGESTSMSCTGPDSAPRRKTQQAKVSADVRPGTSASVSIVADLQNVESNTLQHKNISLSGNARLYQLDISSANHVTIAEKFFRRNANYSGRLNETIYDINLSGDSLQVTTTYYTNGVMTGEDSWSMRRP